MNSYIRRLLARSVKPSPTSPIRRARPARLRVEGMEDRVVPSAPPAPPGFVSTTTPFTNNTAQTIPTTIAVVTSTLTVSGAGPRLHDLDLTTFIQHTFNSDLDITLRSPSGTVVTITTDNGGVFDNGYNGTLWDDDADPGNEAPSADTFAASNLVADTIYTDLTVEAALAPEEPLSAFRGENPNGVWTLTVSDDAGGDGGTLSSWTLGITTLNGVVPETPAAAFTNSTAQAIGAGAPPIILTSTLAVSGAPTYLQRMTLRTFLTHTFPGNLDITLRSPAGTVVTITSDNAASNDDAFNGTVWDDDADPGNEAPFAAATLAASNTAQDAVYAVGVARATLTPEEALAAFIGEDPNGTWTLTISDDTNLDGGSLNSWTLNLFGAGPPGLPFASASPPA